MGEVALLRTFLKARREAKATVNFYRTAKDCSQGYGGVGCPSSGARLNDTVLQPLAWRKLLPSPQLKLPTRLNGLPPHVWRLKLRPQTADPGLNPAAFSTPAFFQRRAGEGNETPKVKPQAFHCGAEYVTEYFD